MSLNPGTEHLVKTVQELSLARDLETVMRIVRSVARNLTGADGATFILRDGDNSFYADEDAIGPLWKGGRFPMRACISGWVMMNSQAAVIEDIYADERIPVEAYKPTFVKSLAMVPIRAISPIGAIGNYWAHPHKPTTEEVTLLQALADITAVTLENVNVYAELEQRVKDRTSQLEDANRELEAFSYSISHDLRTPLRALIGYSNILEEEYSKSMDDDGKRVISIIQENAVRMNTLIDDLLEFSRLGKKELQCTSIDMEGLVRKLIQDMSSASGFVTAFEVNLLFTGYGDPALISQVWINLISNAVKYSSKKQNPAVVIGSYKESHKVVYYIRDNGVGFDMAYVSQLFGVFQRLHKVSEFEGTGVGLSIVQRIIHKHGGRTWAEGKIDDGAVFYFSLPDRSSMNGS